jgi:diguanylate cyclase (GGDEF)-like protein
MSEQGNILLLDHDESCRKTVSDFLVASGYTVEVATDDDMAVRRTVESAFDAVIVGIDSEIGLTGGPILRMKSTGSSVEVIAITEHNSANQSMEALAQGAYCYVQRPVQLPVLLHRVRNAVAHHMFHTSTQTYQEQRGTSGSELRNRIEGMQRLLRFDRELMATLDFRRILDAIMNGLLDMAGADTLAVLLARDRIHSVGALTKDGTAAPSSDAIISALLHEWDKWGSEKVDLTTLHLSGIESDTDVMTSDHVVAPLIVKDTVIGVIGVFSTEGRTIESEGAGFVPVVATRAEVVIENALLATTDSLTGLLNRSVLNENLQREFERTHRYSLDQRQGIELSVVMCDVDHFKNFNDTYGHQLGDEVLKSVATVLVAEARRATDIVARYGGEEFIIVAPDTSLENAMQLAERIRERLAATSVDSSSGELFVTASFGVSSYPECGGGTPEILVKQADDALYVAKDSGRNCVATAPIADESAPVIQDTPAT